ncbi:MAG: CsoS2 family carboxysome shell protein [Thioalkalivibrionaceae bacterium]
MLSNEAPAGSSEQAIEPSLFGGAAPSPRVQNVGPSRGRARAVARRTALAQNGKRGLGLVRGAAPSVQKLMAAAGAGDVDCSNMSGREVCRIRRQALAENGKSVLGKNKNERSRGDALRALANRKATARATVAGDEATDGSRDSIPDGKKSCGCGCNGKKLETAQSPAPAGSLEAGLDTLCLTVDRADDGRGKPLPEPIMSRARALCMARREALAHNGKKAIVKRRLSAGTTANSWQISEAWRQAQRRGVSGREVARARRQELCHQGRGSCSPARPSGRIRPEAPQKVDLSSTLSGQTVSGTSVEQRRGRVTGTESGVCRSVTGTEYLGVEHFTEHCGVTPEPGAVKVHQSVTARGLGVSGTSVSRSDRVTGTESGACQGVTGTEYLGVEDIVVCGRTPKANPAKIGVMTTAKGGAVSGSVVGRSGRVTGDETGSCRSVTGTEYLNAKDSEAFCAPSSAALGGAASAPTKVGVMHTLKGKSLTGSVVGHSTVVTGTEAGGCKPVTGTEYLGAEDIGGFCGAKTIPTAPEKVGLSQTNGDQPVTGSVVARSVQVTGGEAGECRSLTGTQYLESGSRNSACQTLCDRTDLPTKVGLMHTLRGREVSGSVVESSVRVTGDEYGGCKPITGTEYLGIEHFDRFCHQRPNPAPEKVAVGQTWNAQTVTGTAVGRSPRVTGDEYGSCKPITGTSYVGPDQVAAFCDSSATALSAARSPVKRSAPAMPVTGSQPGYDDDVTGSDRGACVAVSGSPYVGADQQSSRCEAGEIEPVVQGGFSIMTPARAGLYRRERSVTGMAYEGDALITGPVNKALGLVTGTEEFRHAPRSRWSKAIATTEANEPTSAGQGGGMQAPMALAMARANQASDKQQGRVTGEGSDAGISITGDSWTRGQNVTGNEGPWAVRNASAIGRGVGMALVNARANRELERPEIPMSRITGSAGNTSSGAAVTVSGGARA